MVRAEPYIYRVSPWNAYLHLTASLGSIRVPASLPLHLGPLLSQIRAGDLNTSMLSCDGPRDTKWPWVGGTAVWMSHVLGGLERDGTRFPHSARRAI